MPCLPFLLLLLVGSGLSQPTLDLFDTCDAMGTVTENLVDFSMKINNRNKFVENSFRTFESKLENVKVSEDASKDVQDKLTELGETLDVQMNQKMNEIKKAIDNIEIPVKYIEKCSNNTYTNPVYNKSCDRGWLKINNRCYYMQNYRTALATDAQKWCEDTYGARLASVKSKEVFDKLKAGFPHTDKECHWVAAYRLHENEFFWEDCSVDMTGRQICSRESVNSTLWRSGFPAFGGCHYFSRYQQCTYNSQSSLYVCYTRAGLANRGNQKSFCLCEYSL